MRRVLGAALVCLWVGAGCATYSDHTRAARSDLRRGDLESGTARLNQLLGVRDSRELPHRFGSETALTLLERATVLQAMGDYRTSARDFTAAEKELEFLDIANDTVGNIGQYVYSDSATKYKTTPTEKLLLNGFNMINYLALGDVSGALVEARRFQVMRRYLNDHFPKETRGAFASYLAGFAFEKAGQPEVALRHYDEVLSEIDLPSLHGPVRRLAQNAHFRSPRIERLLGEKAEPQPEGEILVVLKTGSVPVKEPRRIPIGAALGLATAYVTGDTRVLEYGMFKVVSYPELVPTRDLYSGGRLRVGGRAEPLDLVTHISREVQAEYEEIKPKIIGAALTRMIVRAAAAEGARAAGNTQGSGLGFLAALVVEGTLTALDKPDTRSWSTLPGRVHIARIPVAPGNHEVEVDVTGAGGVMRMRRSVHVPKGGFAVVDFTTLR